MIVLLACIAVLATLGAVVSCCVARAVRRPRVDLARLVAPYAGARVSCPRDSRQRVAADVSGRPREFTPSAAAGSGASAGMSAGRIRTDAGRYGNPEPDASIETGIRIRVSKPKIRSEFRNSKTDTSPK